MINILCWIDSFNLILFLLFKILYILLFPFNGEVVLLLFPNKFGFECLFVIIKLEEIFLFELDLLGNTSFEGIGLFEDMLEFVRLVLFEVITSFNFFFSSNLFLLLYNLSMKFKIIIL